MDRTKCKIEDCPKDAFGRGWCRFHYEKWRTYGNPLFASVCEICGKPGFTKTLCRSCMMKNRWDEKERLLCCVSGCTNKHYGNGFCKPCYERLKNMGTLESIKVLDLPNEEWRDIRKPGFERLMVSNMGRMKSCRKRDEKLLKSRMIKVNPHETQLTRTATNGYGGENIFVHMEVLRAFHPNPDGDFRAIFIDGDRSNCRADNLRWYGRKYLVEKAIKIAEKSEHPLANAFILFWQGDYNVLNSWFEEQIKWVGPYMRARLDMFRVPYYVDIDNHAQETILQVFLSLRRGMIKELTEKSLKSWIRSIAKKVLASGIRDLLPAISNDLEDFEGNSYSITDRIRWCH